MGLGFDLTRQHPDLTPIYIKPLASGLYAELSGNNFVPTTTGLLKTDRYMEEDASLLLDGVDDHISISAINDAQRLTALATNYNTANKSGHRLVSFMVTALVTTATYGLYSWYRDANNHERLWIDVAGSVYTLRYKVKVAGATIYDISRVISITANIWNIVQVHHSNSSTDVTVRLTLNGALQGAAVTDATNTAIAFAGATSFYVGRCLSEDGLSSTYFAGYLDVFLVRLGLQFSSYWTYNPTSPTWSKDQYSAGNLVAKTLGTRKLIAPSVYPENSSPQGIACFKTIRDRTYLMGINPNKRISIAVPYDVPEVTETVGTALAGQWKYLFSFFDSATGMESCFGTLSDTFLPANPLNHNVITVPANLRIETGSADLLKVYRVNAAGNYYFVGMIDYNLVSSLVDDIAAASLTEMLYFRDDEDLYVIDDFGIPTPPDAVVALAAGGTLDNPGTYDVAFVIYDKLLGRESGLLLKTGYATTGVNKTISATVDVPTGYDSGRYEMRSYIRKIGTQNYLYRALALTATGTISGTTIVLNIDAPNVSGDNVIDPALVAMPDADYAEHHLERLFKAGVEGDLKNKLIFSELGNLETYQPLNNFIIGASTRPITGLLSHLGDLLIMKETEIWKLVGIKLLDAQLFQIAGNAGCISHNSIVVLGDYAFWLGISNAYMYDGSRITAIGDDIADLLRTMDTRMRPFVSAAVDEENGLILFGIRVASTVSGAISSRDTITYNYNNDTILCYNFADSIKSGVNRWTTWNIDTSHVCSGTIDTDSKQKVYFVNLYGADNSTPMATHKTGYGKFDPDTNLDTGNPDSLQPQIIWKSVPIAPDIDNRYKYKYVSLDTDNAESVGMTVGYVVNGNLATHNFGIGILEHYTKNVAARSRFIGPYVAVNTQGNNARLLGFTLSYEELEER